MDKTTFVVFALISLVLACVASAAEPSKKPLSILIVVQDQRPVHLRSALRSIEDAIVSKDTPELDVIISHVGPISIQKRDVIDSILSSRHIFSTFRLVEGETGDNVAKALNRFVKRPQKRHSEFSVSSSTPRAARLAVGDHLLFMSESSEVESWKDIQEMIDAFKSDEHIGVVGNRILYDDGTVFSAGIDFIMAKNPTKQLNQANAWNWGTASRGRYGGRWSGSANSVPEDVPAPVQPTPSEELNEVPVILHRMQGYTSLDSRVTKSKEVRAVSREFLMVKKATFDAVNGFDTAFNAAYIDVDFCIRLKSQKAMKSHYLASSVARHQGVNSDEAANDSDDNYKSDAISKDLTTFTNKWGTAIAAELDSKHELKNLTLIWGMDCGTGQVLGFTTEATNLLMGLWESIRVKINVGNEMECKEELRKAGFPLHVRKVMAILMDRSDKVDKEEVVAVLHKDPGRYASLYSNDGVREASYVIGRSMFETNNIPLHWVEPCKKDVDEVWVPSHFNVDTFTKAGINASTIHVIPETIDVDHFDPQVHIPVKLNGAKEFNFLFISKWEERKAWNVLLSAFLDEFSAEKDREKVVLFLRARMDEKARKEYSEFIEKYIKDNEKKKEELPSIVLLEDLAPYTKLPALYKAADCFVLPAHGEGWGLPLMEAMSMELPAIATNWSGNTEFMKPTNSFLIKVKELVNAPEEGHQWAQPDKADLQVHLRFVYESRGDAKKIGKKARQDVVTEFSQSAVKDKIVTRLRELQPHLPEHRARRAANPRNSWSFSYSSDSTTNSNSNINTNTGQSWNYYTNGAQTFEDSQGRTRVKIRINDEKSS